MKLIKFYIVLFVIFLIFSFQAAAAQSLPINIDQLSDQQLIQYMGMASNSGMSDADLVAKAKAKGLTDEQIQQLRLRIQNINSAKTTTAGVANVSDARAGSIVKVAASAPQKINNLPVFGSELFSNENLTFEPNLQIATPRNYMIGTNDQLNIDLFGYSDISFKLKVSPEGEIRIPNLGPIKISGLNFDDARQKIKSQLSKIYPQINSGQTSVQVTLGQIRSIRITMIGEIQKPGTYTLPSLATIANALYVSGGPNAIGSYRNIQLVRNGKPIAVFDLYDFLLRGDLTKNLRLEEDDIVKVNIYERRVSIEGAVRRNAIYEIKSNDRLKELVATAGGFTETAFTDLIRIIRIGKKEKEIINVTAQQFSQFELHQGDAIMVDNIADKFSNKITISGSVYHSGMYSLLEYSNLNTLIQKAVLREESYLKRGIINRKDSSFQPQIIDFNVADILSGKKMINLQKEDQVYIYTINELKEAFTVSINGEVLKSGSFAFVDSLNLQDIILQAGGFKESASKKRIEISRRIREATDNEMPQYALVQTIELDKNLEHYSSQLVHYLLQPFDIISVRKDPSYKEQSSLTVEGQVLYPGIYTILKKQERLSDIISRAGGFRSDAYPKGAVLIRSKVDQAKSRVQEVERTNLLGNSDSLKYLNSDSLFSKVNSYTSSIGIRLEEAVKHPNSKYDIFVEEGDVISVPKEPQTVKIWGGVYLPKQIVFDAEKSFQDYINASGGFVHMAQRSKSFVLYANGEVARTHRVLFFRKYPRIEAGAEVFVPLRKTKKTFGIAEAGSIMALITGVATTFWIIRSL